MESAAEKKIKKLYYFLKGLSINDVTHLGGEGDLLKGDFTSKSILSKMDDKGKGRVKNLQKWVTSFMDGLNSAENRAEKLKIS